jgi:tRNA threonylcarbamoyladenosine biosynthesis protein TsaE
MRSSVVFTSVTPGHAGILDHRFAAAAVPTLKAFRTLLPDAPATEQVGRAIARALSPGMIVTLSGDLGAGKTTLARGVLRGLGWAGPVKSPSYTLVEHYPFPNLYLYHFDFYRFEDVREWDDAGFAEAFRRDTVCLVEWPERVAGRLRAADLAITLQMPDEATEGRTLVAVASTEAGERCLNALTNATRG